MAIGTALTVAGIASQAAGTASSFIQAGKERRAADKAAAEAAKALEETHIPAITGTSKESLVFMFLPI